MSIPSIQASLNAGELSPDLYGRVDLAKYRSGCSTMRNFFASYRGGASSRPGMLFVGQCKQGNQNTAGSVAPPRNIAFQYNINQGITIEAGDNYFRFVSNGGYITEAATTITGITAASPGVVTDVAHGYSNGDEVFITVLVGPIQLNNRSFLVANVAANTYTLVNPLTGAAISTAALPAYVSGGKAARIYTLDTPYAATDLPAVKFSESEDVMTITHPSYPPYDLARITSNHWTLVKTTYGASIAAPGSVSLSETDSGISTPSFYYQFVATAVDAVTGQESIASPIGTILAVDIATEAATITIDCAAVVGAGSFNFYAAAPTYKTPQSAGSLFGYIGTSFGPSFTDTNVIANYTIVPPLHRDPFATSSVLAILMSSGGSNYSATATTASVTSPIGKNPSLTPIIINGAISWVVVNTGGAGMTGGEVVHFVDTSLAGHGATATLSIGPATGTFPSCSAYFQQRRFYANTINSPDTYFASQTGAFTNMDTSIPTIASDAIIGTPWSQQVNGIQWMLNMPGGLVIFTGLGAWQLSGSGGGLATAAAITPESQVANPQAYNGCSPTVPPIAINYDILYVQQMGSKVRDLSYNFFVNIYTGTDLTVLSNHLFDGHQIIQWAWSEEPNKLVWCVREDGILLSLTFLKEQDVYAWSRHDTNGLFQSVSTVSEPPVNAPYFIVKRLIQNNGSPVWAYFQERMDDRLWDSLETSWCVDAGLSYPQAYPNAALAISNGTGILTLVQPILIYGGNNYSSSTYAVVADPTGIGATANITISGGVVTAASVSGTLTGYTAPEFRVIDPTMAGGGAVISISVIHTAVVGASAPVFANVAGQGQVGDVIRKQGNTLVVYGYVNSTTLQVAVQRDESSNIPDDPYETEPPSPGGSWSIAAPVSVLHGLDHLEGMLVSILADGVALAPQTVSSGAITLPQPATAVTIGLGFTAQLQTMYLDIQGGVTVQGRRKEIDSMVTRISASGLPFYVGTNQPDAASQPRNITVPWKNLVQVNGPPSNNSPIQPTDLVTGDIYADVFDQLGGTGGQVAIQQSLPLPLNLLAVIPSVRIQDDVDAA